MKETTPTEKVIFSTFLSLWDHFWPCHEISQDQPKIYKYIYINLKELTPQMLYTLSFKEIGLVVLEKILLKIFTIYGHDAWRPSWSCEMNHIYIYISGTKNLMIGENNIGWNSEMKIYPKYMKHGGTKLQSYCRNKYKCIIYMGNPMTTEEEENERH